MEIYDPKTKKTRHYRPKKDGEDSRVFFKPSALNEWLPLWEKWAFFFLGFIGLQVLSLLISLLLSLTPVREDASLSSSLLNFLCYLLLTLFVLAFLFFDGRKTYKRFAKEFTEWKTYAYAVMGFVLILVVNYAFNAIYTAAGVTSYGDSENQQAIIGALGSSPALMVIATCLFAPFVEEFTYRIGLVDTIGHKNRIVGIVFSAIIFGAIHFDWTSLLSYLVDRSTVPYETILNELLNLPVYVLSGAALAFTYAKSGKISSSMMGHFLNNTLSVISIFAL